MKGIRKIQQEALERLTERGIELRRFRKPVALPMRGGERYRYNLPAHNETTWFRAYVQHCLEKGTSSERIEELAREAYGLLRYKQALAGSSDGSPLAAFFALSGHVLPNDAKRVHQRALEEYDEKSA